MKSLPQAVAKVGGDRRNQRGGMIQKNALMQIVGVRVDLENFDINLSYPVKGYEVSAIIKGKYVEGIKSKSARFTKEQIEILKKTGSGDKVFIENIKAMGVDSILINYGSIILTIE